MRRIVRNLSIFLVGLAVCFAAASAYFELRVRQTGDFFRQVAWFRMPEVAPKVLLIGDSRMAANIDPRLLPPGFYNFSYPGATLREIYLRAKFALETKPGIEYLVIGIEDVTFSNARAREFDASRQTLFASLADLAEIYPASPRFLLRHAVLHYAPLVNAGQRYRTWDAVTRDVSSAFHDVPRRNAAALDCGGFRLLREGQWAELDRAERVRMAREDMETMLGGSVANAEMHKVFEKLLDLARRHHVRVIGLRNPLSGAYLEVASNYYDRPVLAFLDRSRLHAMLDYETLYLDDPSLFYNADHLNSRGAERFTRKVAADLQSLTQVHVADANRCETDLRIATPRWPYNDVLLPLLAPTDCLGPGGVCIAGTAMAQGERPGPFGLPRGH